MFLPPFLRTFSNFGGFAFWINLSYVVCVKLRKASCHGGT